MRFGHAVLIDGKPVLPVSEEPTGCLYDVRVRAIASGRTYVAELVEPIHTDNGEFIEVPSLGAERVVYRAMPITVSEWFESDVPIGLRAFLENEALESGSGPEQDQDQDHEPDVGQNEPETPQDGLTTLQRQIFTELNEHGAGTVAELIDRLGMPGMQAAIRKNLHILMDEKHLVGKRSSIQNGRPAQLWEVL